jgi:hypothetical protein
MLCIIEFIYCALIGILHVVYGLILDMTILDSFYYKHQWIILSPFVWHLEVFDHTSQTFKGYLTMIFINLEAIVYDHDFLESTIEMVSHELLINK